jgi:hypothetical protein
MDGLGGCGLDDLPKIGHPLSNIAVIPIRVIPKMDARPSAAAGARNGLYRLFPFVFPLIL